MFSIGDRHYPRDARLVMGIINATPDSFYDQGRTRYATDALRVVEGFVEAGADIIDIGGVKAGRGAFVDAAEEITRVRPVIRAIRSRFPDLPLSLDTWRAEVAEVGVAEGIDLINDAWGGYDPRLAVVAADSGTSLVCTHTGGLTPRTYSSRPRYNHLVADVSEFLLDRARRAEGAGVATSRIILDPGHDFAKNTWQSLQLTKHLDQLTGLGYPVLVAPSNKDFIGESLNLPKDERLEGTMAVLAVCAWHRANLFRVHNVRESRRVLDMVAAIAGERAPAAVRALI